MGSQPAAGRDGSLHEKTAWPAAQRCLGGRVSLRGAGTPAGRGEEGSLAAACLPDGRPLPSVKKV